MSPAENRLALKPRSIVIESLTLVVSGRCNLQCDHCVIDARREWNTFFDDRFLPGILEGMGRLGLDRVFLAGGEALSFGELCFGLCERFRDAGIQVVLASNAFWATDESVAEEMAARLAGAGVALLRITVDQRSQPAVGVSNVRRAALAAFRHGMHYEIHIRSLDSAHALQCLETLKSLEVQSALVRTSTGPKEICRRAWAEAYRPARTTSSGCPRVDHPAVLYDGTVVACCDSLVFPCHQPSKGSPLVLGRLVEGDLIGILREASTSPVLALLREYGPDRIWETMLARGGVARMSSGGRLGSDSRCLLCYGLFGDARSTAASLAILFGEFLDRL